MTQSTSLLAEATTVDVSAAQKHGVFLLDVKAQLAEMLTGLIGFIGFRVQGV